MIEGTNRVEIEDVEVLDYGNMVMRCRVGDRILWAPSLALLLGTNIKYRGDRGRLVLPQDLAVDLGLVA
jgi:cytochrome c-type biogenesis protein CcmH/NrfF